MASLNQAERAKLAEIVDAAFDDVLHDLIREIKDAPGTSREIQLSQLDVLERSRERINARLDYRDSTGAD